MKKIHDGFGPINMQAHFFLLLKSLNDDEREPKRQ